MYWLPSSVSVSVIEAAAKTISSVFWVVSGVSGDVCVFPQAVNSRVVISSASASAKNFFIDFTLLIIVVLFYSRHHRDWGQIICRMGRWGSDTRHSQGRARRCQG